MNQAADDVIVASMCFVYMVRCADGTLYTGWTRDPRAREQTHNAGTGAKYTRSRLPVSLAYVEECASLSAALKRERQLKRWTRAKKESLIADDLARLQVLAMGLIRFGGHLPKGG